MKCYVKDPRTFTTTGIYDVSQYDIFLYTIFDDVSKITVNQKDAATEGDIIYCDNGWMGIVKSYKNDTGKSTLSCIDMINIFDTDKIIMDSIWGYPNALQDYEGYVFYTYINDLFTTIDPIYKKDYVKIELLTNTRPYPYDFIYPDPIDDVLFNLKNYFEKVRRVENIFIDYSIGHTTLGDKLIMRIGKRNSGTKKIDLSDKSYFLINENYTNEMVGRVTTHNPNELVDYARDWFLKTDGTIAGPGVEDMPDEVDRVNGKHKTIKIDDNNLSYEKAQDIFEKNKYSHRIEFSTERELDFYDLLQLRINGRVLNSYISSVRVKSDSNRFFYTSGEMRTTLTDKLKELI